MQSQLLTERACPSTLSLQASLAARREDGAPDLAPRQSLAGWHLLPRRVTHQDVAGAGARSGASWWRCTSRICDLPHGRKRAKPESEALRLTRADVDLAAGLLTIAETKFHKSRLVPLHPSVTAALTRYAAHRDRPHPSSTVDSFFLTEKGTRLKYWRAMMAFTTLRRQVRWSGHRLPRIHDLRHTFAVRRLLQWYEEGCDVDREIVALSTYLGHVKVTDTYWYLSAVPELLAAPAARFERFAHASPGRRP